MLAGKRRRSDEQNREAESLLHAYLLLFFEELLETIEAAVPACAVSVAFFGVGQPFVGQDDLRLAAEVTKFEGDESVADVAVIPIPCIDEFLRSADVLEDSECVEGIAVGVFAHRQAILSSLAEIDFGRKRGVAGWAEPLLQRLRLGPGAEVFGPRRGEGAQDLELARGAMSSCIAGGHESSLVRSR